MNPLRLWLRPADRLHPLLRLLTLILYPLRLWLWPADGLHPLLRLLALILYALLLWLRPVDWLHPLLRLLTLILYPLFRLLTLILYPLGFTLWPLRPLCSLRWLDRLDPLLVFCPLLSYPAAWCRFRPVALFKPLWSLFCVTFSILLLAV